MTSTPVRLVYYNKYSMERWGDVFHLQVVGSEIKGVETVPNSGVVPADARVTEALEQQQLHGSLMPP